MNKKGISEAMADFFGYIAFAIVFVLFLILFGFKSHGTTNTISAEQMDSSADQWLLSLAQTDLEVDGETRTVGDWISRIDYVDFSKEWRAHIQESVLGTPPTGSDDLFKMMSDEQRERIPFSLIGLSEHGVSRAPADYIMLIYPAPTCTQKTTLTIPKINGGTVQIYACMGGRNGISLPGPEAALSSGGQA
ncbi:MAG: hypothetical protein ABIH41_00970 [Nanoarchaeota archaeon]